MPAEPDASDGRLNVMLEEYRALRAESVARMSSRGTLTGFLAASLALVLSKDQPAANVWAVGAATTAIASVWLYSLAMLRRLRSHLVSLQRMINDETTRVHGGDDVLTWEGSFGS